MPQLYPPQFLRHRQQKGKKKLQKILVVALYYIKNFFSAPRATVALSQIRSDRLEKPQELSANIYTTARSESSNLSEML